MSDEANEPSTPGEDPLSAREHATILLELWKQAVSVQQHFNDIEFRVRGLALSAATFSLGAGAVAVANDARAGYVSVGAVIVALGLVLWQAFYFVDRYWFHVLLKSAVEQGTLVEAALRAYIPSAGLTSAITGGSPVQVTRFFRLFAPRAPGQKPRKLHSDEKIVVFYRIGSTVLLAAAVAFQIGALLPTPRTDELSSVTPGSIVSEGAAPADLAIVSGRTLAWPSSRHQDRGMQ